MKKITLSSLAALSLAASSASALTFYEDANGQVFTSAAEGRKEIKAVPVTAHASKLSFSGVHYLGMTSRDYKEDTVPGVEKFEIRRSYVQVKAYFNDKDYMRITLDSNQNDGASEDVNASTDQAYKASDAGSLETRFKYAYVYLDDVLPATGMEFGLAHRPWLDYEEHAGWWHRSIQKTALETKRNADFTNSADFGVNFKTKTKNFTSEIGLFNGEGYHQAENDDLGYSFEWRLTGVLMGDGTKKHKPLKDTYLEASFFGQEQDDSGKTNGANYHFYGYHAVYNQPNFLISAQYTTADNAGAKTSKQGSYTSVNMDYRFGDKLKYQFFARQDAYTSAITDATKDYESTNTIVGVSYQMNKQVRWLLSSVAYDYTKVGTAAATDSGKDYTDYMLTAEVHW